MKPKMYEVQAIEKSTGEIINTLGTNPEHLATLIAHGISRNLNHKLFRVEIVEIKDTPDAS